METDENRLAPNRGGEEDMEGSWDQPLLIGSRLAREECIKQRGHVAVKQSPHFLESSLVISSRF